MFKVRNCDVRRSVVLSSMVRQGSLEVLLLGFVRPPCPARLRDVSQGVSLRALVLYRTVLSCPARHRKARRFELWYGMVERVPVRLGQVLLGSVRQGISWRGRVLRGRAQHGEVLHGRVKRSSLRFAKVFQGGVCSDSVLHGSEELSAVWQGKVLSWSGDVLFGVAGFIGALHSKVRSYCGVVWNRKALQSLVKFCPVKHCYVWHGIIEVLHCLEWHCRVWLGTVACSWASFGNVLFGSARLGDAESC